ncbi:MAG: type IV toxin-antitoxin system AbiEi family antitoxin domain-containing protein [Alphaproteobacteria bacterium]|nr:type IV toxin-antitoxin system AbiEi family antitoxin domain-containing protein [Alphaproteobacteria bacterium]
MKKTLETQLLNRIDRKRGDVFLRADFADLGGYDQVGRALRQAVRSGRLLRIGSGLYARARPSAIDGAPTPVKGLRELAHEALRRLGVRTAPTRLEQDYSAGKTTQVPSGRRLAVNKRVRRKIGYNGAVMSFERAGPAPR